MAPGTARKPASVKLASLQSWNLVGTLSHHGPGCALLCAPTAPWPMRRLGLRRKESSTAFFSHWLTVQAPDALRSATRCEPLSSAARAASTASRTAPLVEADREARSSHAASMVAASCFTSVTRLSVSDGAD